MFDKAKIMRNAWNMAREMAYHCKRPVSQFIAQAMRNAWTEAKRNAQVRASVAADAARFAAIPQAELVAKLQWFEYSDRLSIAERDEWSALSAEYRRRMA